ncbi:MAG: PEP-CTERM sorting domain-containing protein [Lacunisphaera sp.]|nr:PEP-CTERM sorting domain-containing protein [Lacunisphaera sp.]
MAEQQQRVDGRRALHLFDQPYLGTPSDITSGPGLLATSSTYSGGSYSFSGGVVLAPDTYYWVYTSTAQQVGLTIGNAYTDGSYYSASGSGVNYTMNVGGTDAAFVVTATAIPEPSTYAALAGLAALGLAAWRRHGGVRIVS